MAILAILKIVDFRRLKVGIKAIRLRIGEAKSAKMADFSDFGSRVGWLVNPMVLVSMVGHLKQQVSVT